MLRTINSRFWDEPVVPLTAQQIQAATESHDYALAHDLVLALETDDHLQFHYSVADNEIRRIPTVERSLADNHLPPLVLFPTKIEELWTVPRRVADVLEAACRWLTEEELKVCEEAVVNYRPKKAALSAVERARLLKLEKPLLLTDPDEDCANLQKAATAAVNCGEDCVRKHGFVQNNREERDLFFIPIDASIYAAHMEETARTEKMVVSEQSIRSLMTLMGSMEWTDKDQAALLDQQTTMPTLVHRYVSPPLPPVDDIEYFVPNGDVCLVSDASDVSSGVSEALEEAERLLTEQTGEVWKDEAVDLGLSNFPSYTFDESIDNLCMQLPMLNARPHHEPDISMSMSMPPSLSPDLGGISLEKLPTLGTEDDEFFSSWIDESMLVDEDKKNDKALQPVNRVEANAALSRVEDKIEDIKEELELGGSLSGSGSQGEMYQELTEDALFALEENEVVVQAKIPVPAVGIESSLPEWHSVGDSPLDMLQWMMRDAKASNEELGWKESYYLPNDDLDELTVHYANLCTETIDTDEQYLDDAVLWIRTVPDTQFVLINSIKPAAMPRRVDNEEPLDIPEDAPENAPDNASSSEEVLLTNEAILLEENVVAREVADIAPKSTLKAPENDQEHLNKGPPKGQSDRKQIQRDVDTAWSNLMNRHKKRKKVHTPSSSMPVSATAQEGQSIISTKVPELLLGLRAFAEAPTQELKGDGLGQVQGPRSIAEAATIVIEKGPTVQPLDVGDVDLPKAILSTTIPRTLRTVLLQLLPTLEFVERDYKQLRPGFEGIDTSNEADLVVSPSAGVIMSTMVGLRQTDSQKRPVLQSRLAAVAPRYKILHVLIYRNNARPIRTDEGSTMDDMPELSPSDAMALAQLQGFVHSLPCNKISVSYISGGEQAVAEWTASLLIKEANNVEGRGKRQAAEKYLLEEENEWELFFRKAGFNVYDAQIVLGVMVDSASRESPVTGMRAKHPIRTAMETGIIAEGRMKQLESMLGCQTAMVAFRLLGKNMSLARRRS